MKLLSPILICGNQLSLIETDYISVSVFLSALLKISAEFLATSGGITNWSFTVPFRRQDFQEVIAAAACNRITSEKFISNGIKSITTQSFSSKGAGWKRIIFKLPLDQTKSICSQVFLLFCELFSSAIVSKHNAIVSQRYHKLKLKLSCLKCHFHLKCPFIKFIVIVD